MGIISYITAQSLEEVKYLREQYDDSFWGSHYAAVKREGGGAPAPRRTLKGLSAQMIAEANVYQLA